MPRNSATLLVTSPSTLPAVVSTIGPVAAGACKLAVRVLKNLPRNFSCLQDLDNEAAGRANRYAPAPSNFSRQPLADHFRPHDRRSTTRSLWLERCVRSSHSA